MAGYKSAISFGLVHIPVRLIPVISNNDTSFNMIHKKCESRIKYQKYCPHCKTEVQIKDLVKGYEYRKDEYVILDEKDLENIKSINDKIIEIIAFVNLNEIDPIYFEKSYFLTAESKNKAYGLFKAALKKENKVAVAKTVLGTKSYYVILRFGNDSIIMNTLYYEEEIKIVESSGKDNFTKQEIDLALKLINNMTDSFKPETYKDDYQEKIKDAINNKIKGKEVKPSRKKVTKNIDDLMTALQESIKKRKIK